METKEFHICFRVSILKRFLHFYAIGFFHVNSCVHFHSGHTYDYELLQYTENCLLVLKNVFLSLSMPLDRAGALYLMYAMYFKQPTKEFCKFRFTMTEWDEMKAFFNHIYSDSHYVQVRMVFWKLWKANAFRFVECDQEFGLEPLLSEPTRSEEVAAANFEKTQPQILSTTSTLKDQSTGLVSAIDSLQVGYNEMKEHLAQSNENCAGLQASTIMEGIMAAIEGIEQVFAPSSLRKKKKVKNAKQIRKGSETVIVEDDEEEADVAGDTDPDCEIGSTDESGSEFADIGLKRSYLKRKAMNKTARLLIHGSSYNDVEPKQSSSSQESPSPRKSAKVDVVSPRASAGGHDDETVLPIIKARKLVEYDDEKGVVRITQAATGRTRSRISKNSVVRKQFTDCPA